MTNVSRFLLALASQIAGDTQQSLALMKKVEPMQEADSFAVVSAILANPAGAGQVLSLIDLLVNSAIVGMTDNRESGDLFHNTTESGIKAILKQNRGGN